MSRKNTANFVKGKLNGEPGCMPKHNYSTGAGWKTSKKHNLDFTPKSKKRKEY